MLPITYRENAETITLMYIKVLLADTHTFDKHEDPVAALEDAANLIRETHQNAYINLSYDNLVYAYVELVGDEIPVDTDILETKACELQEQEM